jgi:hypothetical protein
MASILLFGEVSTVDRARLRHRYDRKNRQREFIAVIISKGVTKCLSRLMAAVFLVQILGCGTILYPERKGQTGGQIDPGVAVLDAAGLLLFIVPGLIAFGVDFSTGTIYLPPGKSQKAGVAAAPDEIAVIKVNPEDLNVATLERILRNETGLDIGLTSPGVAVYQVEGNMKRAASFDLGLDTSAALCMSDLLRPRISSSFSQGWRLCELKPGVLVCGVREALQ